MTTLNVEKYVYELIQQLKHRNIRLRTLDGRLQCIVPKGEFLNKQEKGEIKKRKKDIVSHLLRFNDLEERRKCAANVYPLSPLQKGMLFYSIYAPNSDLYCSQLVWDYEGYLNPSILKEAWLGVIKQHDILRTSFKWECVEEPIQIVEENVELEWHEYDWSNIRQEKYHDLSMKEYLYNDRKKGFDFKKAGLHRLHLIKTSHNKHSFIWTFHHILLDGWCIPLLLNELHERYQAILSQKLLYLPKPPQYGMYINWVKNQNKKEAQQYWNKQLEGFEGIAQLNINKKPLSIHGVIENMEEEKLTLNRELTNRCKIFARRHCITLNTLFELMWAATLSKYAVNKDVIFGVTVSGRSGGLPQAENMIGLFINVVPIRVVFDDIHSVYEHLMSLHKSIQMANLYSYLPLNEVSNINPLFYSVFVFENYPLGNGSGKINPNLHYTYPRFYEKNNLPLTIIVDPGDCISINISYDVSCFDREAISNLLLHVKQALDFIINNPNGYFNQLCLLTSAEKNKLLLEWNSNTKEYPLHKNIQSIFEEQAEKYPSNISVVCEGESLSYRDLNEKANQLAHFLRQKYKMVNSQGTFQDIFVGLFLDRGVEMVIAILGILKSGAAYIPLATEYPIERLRRIIDDSKLKFVITMSSVIDRYPSLMGNNIDIINLDDYSNNELLSFACDNPELVNQARDLAYVMFTSGTTGYPKGLMMEHRSVINYIFEKITNAQMSPNSRVAQFASIGFDASVDEIFSALFCGGSLYIVPQMCKQDVHLLYRFLLEHKTSVALIPPAILQVMPHKPLPDLKTLMITGESCEIETMRLWAKGRRLVNAFGPSESICVTFCNYDETKSSRNIGRPLANVRLYVLDEALCPVPVGIPGELYIAGVGLCRGYLNQQQLTKERFIKNPFKISENDGEVMYRSGDFVRWLPSGELEFLGRTDNQVKIRGIRIELEEIESKLRHHPAISQCTIVIDQDTTTKDKRIVAYYVRKSEHNITSGELIEFLKKHLQVQMLPTRFIELDRFPLTANKKIDKKLLPPPETTSTTNANCVMPSTQIEETLQKIWSQILNLEPNKIGVFDSFFNLGGHSLLSIQLVEKIKLYFKKNIAVAWIFENETINKQAHALKKATSSEFTSVITFKAVSDCVPLFFVHPGGAGVEVYYEFAKQLHKEQAFYGIESYNIYSGNFLIDNLELLASTYVDYLKTVRPIGPYFLGGWSFGGLVAYEMAKQLTSRGDKILNLYMLDTPRPNKKSNALQSKILPAMVDLRDLGRYYNLVPEEYKERREKTMYAEIEMAVKYNNYGIYQADALLFKATEIFAIPTHGDKPELAETHNKWHMSLYMSKDNGWKKHIPRLQIVSIKTNHNDIVKGKNAKEIAEYIQNDMFQRVRDA